MSTLKIHLSHTETYRSVITMKWQWQLDSTCWVSQVSAWLGPGLPFPSTRHRPPGEYPTDKGMDFIGFCKYGKMHWFLTKAIEKSTDQFTFSNIRIKFTLNKIWVFLQTHNEKYVAILHRASSWNFRNTLGCLFSWTLRSGRRVCSSKWTWNATEADQVFTLFL